MSARSRHLVLHPAAEGTWLCTSAPQQQPHPPAPHSLPLQSELSSSSPRLSCPCPLPTHQEHQGLHDAVHPTFSAPTLAPLFWALAAGPTAAATLQARRDAAQEVVSLQPPSPVTRPHETVNQGADSVRTGSCKYSQVIKERPQPRRASCQPPTHSLNMAGNARCVPGPKESPRTGGTHDLTVLVAHHVQLPDLHGGRPPLEARWRREPESVSCSFEDKLVLQEV